VKNNGVCSITIRIGRGQFLPAAPPGGFGGGEVSLAMTQALLLRCDKTEQCPDCLAEVTIIKLT
jgi:hypothetical protein